MNVSIIGGCGHVGLPLAIASAASGHTVQIIDSDPVAVGIVANGKIPFIEPGLEAPLNEALSKGRLTVATDPSTSRNADLIVLVVGTSLGSDGQPDKTVVPSALAEYLPFIMKTTPIVLRSTLYPDTCAEVQRTVHAANKTNEVVYAPERLAEGFAWKEIHELPQVLGHSGHLPDAVREFFIPLGVNILEMTWKEAELLKLLTNSYRLVEFALANEFAEVCTRHGVDFNELRSSIREEYPRASGLARAGLFGGPCLLKDSVNLYASASFDSGSILDAAIAATTAQPETILRRLINHHGLQKSTRIGQLGLSFKPNSDDTRSSPALALYSHLVSQGYSVQAHDPHLSKGQFPFLCSRDSLLADAEVILLATNHDAFSDVCADPRVIQV